MTKDSKATKDEIQRNRNEAYQGGWDDGYSEGFAKAAAIALDAFPHGTAYGRGAKSTICTAFEAAIRSAALEPMEASDD